MLQHLTVENYALIQHISIRFETGFTVITGETGAGKSIIIGALSLILGQRADTGSLTDKEKKCVVEGEFLAKDYELENWFKTNDLDYDDTILLRREIAPSGKSRAFINDTPVNLNLMRELGEKLVDIHSQHAILTLNDPAFQLGIVDEYAGNRQLLVQYNNQYLKLQALQEQLNQLLQKEMNARRDQDYFGFLLNELKAAKLQPNEKAELESELEVQTHAEEIKTNLEQSKHLLSQSDGNLLERMTEMLGWMRKVSAFHSAGERLLLRLESVWIELKDLSQEIDRLEESVVSDPERLEQLNQRLGLIYQLEKKHRVAGMDELFRIAKELQEKSDNLVSLEDKIQLAQDQINKEQQLVKQYDDLLSASRQEIIQAASEELSQMVRQLGMPEASVSLNHNRMKEFGPDGSDRIRLMFNANRGGALKEISNVASGGELSRLMLAVKHLLSRKKKLPTMIFDEIDVGISGEIAAKMGAMMQGMSGFMQLVTITHLPQIAGKAKNHLLVFKESDALGARSNIRALTRDERIMEIAKMLSGEDVSEVSVMKAKELMM